MLKNCVGDSKQPRRRYSQVYHRRVHRPQQPRYLDLQENWLLVALLPVEKARCGKPV